MDQVTSFELAVKADCSDSELDQLTRSLSQELELFGADAAMISAGPGPRGTKGDALTLATLAVTILPPLLPRLIDLLQHWMTRDPGRCITIKTMIDGTDVEISLPPTADLDHKALGRFLASARQGKSTADDKLVPPR
jgi:hypothetical protein